MYQEIRLQSKKNSVYRIIENSTSYIRKEFSNLENMRREIDFLKLSRQKKCNVPEIIKIEDNKVYMEDLGETTLLDWYEESEKRNSTNYMDIIQDLCIWLKSFYIASLDYFNDQYIIFDVNFRNFIVKDNKIYGIDFEDACNGKIELDAGRLIAYGLTYDPMLTKWKKEFAISLLNSLSDALNIDKDLIISERDKELARIKIRRN